MYINVHLQSNNPIERRLVVGGPTTVVERFRNGCLIAAI